MSPSGASSEELPPEDAFPPEDEPPPPEDEPPPELPPEPPPELPPPEPPPEDEPERVMVTVNGSAEVSPLVLLFSFNVTILDSVNEMLLSPLPL